MNTPRWARVLGLLERVIDLDPARRAVVYADECADDPSLETDVERLVAADSKAGRFLEEDAPRSTSSPVLSAGSRVRGYTLVRRIATGGMGVVFEAQQERPNRRVALKLVHTTFADATTLLRFQYEAEALGRLRHPGIAQVYEAGVDVDESGTERPFLALEFIDGARHLTDYVREQDLSFADTARLFVEVCAAVQHGHDRGVLHRDLKSSNVLVDPAGAPKVIDFGIAKVLGDANTRATQAGELVGTLSAMSPEQLDGDLDLLDVRSDVYALGALLYELLCGQPPVDLKGLSLTHALIKARNTVPVRPSSARPDLPLELEWIVMRALEPDRERRYGSAKEFAQDLERFLRDEPVIAGPPSTVYRVRKFVRRNRLTVVTSAAVVLALVVGAAVALVQRDHAVFAKERAETAEGLANERLERLAAEARTNRELADFQGGILTSVDPDISGRDVRVVDALRKASADLDERTGLDPKLGLVLRRSIIEAYAALGSPHDVERELVRMRPVWEATYARDDPERLELERLALANDLLLKPAHECEVTARDGLNRVVAQHGTDSDEAARWRLTLAAVLCDEKQHAEAETLTRAALDWFERQSEPEARRAIDARLMLARILNEERRFAEAESEKRRNYDVCRRAYGEEHARTLTAKSDLAIAIGNNERAGEAVVMLKELVTAHERRTGPRSSDALTARAHLAAFLVQAHRPAEALVEIDAVLADARATYGERDSFVYRSRGCRSSALLALGRAEEALAEAEGAFAAATDGAQSDDVQNLDLESLLARTLCFLGRFDAALPHARDGWERARRLLGEDASPTFAFANLYTFCLGSLDRETDAVPVVEALLAAQERRLGRTHPDTLVTLMNLAMMQVTIGDIAAANCNAHDLVARAAANSRIALSTRARALSVLGYVQSSSQEFAAAAESYTMATDCWSRSGEAGSSEEVSGRIDEARMLRVLGRLDEAQAVFESAAALATSGRVSPDVRTRAFLTLAALLDERGDRTHAQELAEMVLASSSALDPDMQGVAQRLSSAH